LLLNGAGPDLLVHAVRVAAAGDALIAPSVTACLLTALSKHRRPTATTP
jgi:DNA-binding NarL/FixJ family response regulator